MTTNQHKHILELVQNSQDKIIKLLNGKKFMKKLRTKDLVKITDIIDSVKDIKRFMHSIYYYANERG